MRILFRHSLAELGEYQAARKYFDVIDSRTQVVEGDWIIPRYSVLPYYRETQEDIERLGGRIINSEKEHRYVANFWSWYYDLIDYTPATIYFRDLFTTEFPGPYILKGMTNSRKSKWNTHMFADTVDKAREVGFRLMDDSLIGEQEIIVRQYEPFIKYGTAIGGLPITKEFRFFACHGKVVAKGFYWSNHPEVVERHKPDVNEVPQKFIDAIVRKVSRHINFFVFDVAQREDGAWRVVELNDGQMSGLSTIDPDEFYCSLKKIVS